MSLDKLKRVRRGHRAFVTKTIQGVNEVCQSYSGSLLEREKLRSLQTTLTDKKKVLQQQDDAIVEQLDKDEDISSDIFESSEFGESISRALVKIDLVLSSSGNHSQETANLSEVASSSQPTVKSKLPKLILKRFSGDPTQWHAFWDSFSAAVHENEGVSKVDKFNYLRSLLDGVAASAIEGFSLTKENYDAAVELLKDRFANTHIIVSSHMDALLKLNAVVDVSDLCKIRCLYDKIETHVRSLQNLGISSESYGSLLIPVIVNKLPEELQLVISRKLEKGSWDAEKFMEEFKTELEARERCSMTNNSNNSHQTMKKEATQRKGKLPYTSSTLFATKGQTYTPTCVYCNQPHSALKCNVVTKPSARRAILRRKGRCFSCLNSGHLAKNCPSKFNCHKCNKRHHTSICEEENNNPKGPPETKSIGTSTMCVNSSTAVLLQTALAYVGNPGSSGRKVKARIVFDSCSQRTYVTQRLRESLDLHSVGRDTLKVTAFGDEEPSQREYEQVQISITAIDGMELYAKGYVVPTICNPICSQTVEAAIEKYPHLRGLCLAEKPCSSNEVEVDVLLGADYYWNFVTNIMRRGESPGPVAIWTRLGWVLSGPVITTKSDNPDYTSVNLTSTHVLRVETSTIQPTYEANMNDELAKFWDLETLGIRKEEPSVYDKFTQDVKFNGDRYEAKLPFKEEHPLLPDNYTVCVKRLGSLINRLQATPTTLQEYHRVIQDQISSGVVEPIKESDGNPPGQVHYLPHKEVVRNDKDTTKLRVVYDASARNNGPSLNDCLYAGPPLTPLIFNILIRFRVHPVAVTADIEKAFLNIAISPEHRDFLRFLWVDDPSSVAPQIQILRFTRVVFGLTSSPFILNATLKHHVNQYANIDPEFVNEVTRSLYVDDFASSSQDVQSAMELSMKVKTRLADGGLNMRKWTSNSPELIEELRKNPTFSKADASTHDGNPSSQSASESDHRVLGQNWNTSTDQFKIEFTKILADVNPNNVTKRIILSTTAKFFDPLGVISPIVLMFKLLFQQLCKTGLSWDETLTESMNQKWQLMISSLKDVGEFSLDRCYCRELCRKETKSVELHAFGDASEASYGACVYVRCEHETEVHCSLIASKTRVAPMTKQSVPRLELLSCLVAARLLSSVKEAIGGMVKIDADTLWSDSTTALHWIRNTHKEYKLWVQNRVAEIRKLSSVETWRYCPTHCNPADVASRGALAKQLINMDDWWHGPRFLQNPKELWPVQLIKQSEDNPDYCQELKSSNTKPAATLVNVEGQPKCKVEELIDPTRYSRIGTMLRVTAYVLRFVRNLQSHLKKMSPVKGMITTEEISSAEKMWIRHLQASLPKMKDYKKVKESLSLFEDAEKIIRCRGRIEASPLPYDTKFPILLPSDHHITRLIVLQSHEDVIHNGERETLTQLRSRFWITKGRQVVKKIISKCTVCRKLEGRGYAIPDASALPDFRLSNDFAFTRIGVDYAGPLYVRDIYSQSKDMHKTYIALYTCASSRAVHLDLVPDNTSQSFVKSFKRFIGRRGTPSLVISDNGKTFKGAELKNFIAIKKIKWRFIVEKSPWWGGFYERLVRCVKRCLNKVLSNARLTYEELLTILIQIEGVLNSRPLTYVDHEGEEPLTPSHLVIGRRILSILPEPEDNVQTQARSNAVKRGKYLKTVLGHFWKRWSSEYLTQLREHHRPSRREGPVISIGDVVSVKEDNVKRLNWQIALVDELIKGRDGEVRAAVVRKMDKAGKIARFRRPLQRLYPIELQAKKAEENGTEIPITFVERAKQENI